MSSENPNIRIRVRAIPSSSGTRSLRGHERRQLDFGHGETTRRRRASCRGTRDGPMARRQPLQGIRQHAHDGGDFGSTRRWAREGRGVPRSTRAGSGEGPLPRSLTSATAREPGFSIPCCLCSATEG
jgi:hypothetical protein